MSQGVRTQEIRRGLPRQVGGARWPDVGKAPVLARDAVPITADEPASPAGASSAAAPTAAATRPSASQRATTRVRRGLPRVAGREAWPPQAFVDSVLALAPADASSESTPPVEVAPPVVAPQAASSAPEPAVEAVPEPTAASKAEFPSGSEPVTAASPKLRPRRVWRAGAAVAALVVGAGILMLAARGLLTFAWVQQFMQTYPGAYPLPEGAPAGFPAWLNWQHFCNAFLMLLIIRSGIQVRREQRPPASWTPRWNAARKISLTLWLHQSLDLLWVVNGLLFVFLLFATGQWMRVVPTSWSVFPNAVSAALRYASLNWPTEDGWVNYNSLQQLTYFGVIFVAAPLAALTGVRMSGLWPKRAELLTRRYPVEVARAVHFPVMAIFVAFIVVHVALVFATGALRNLNHMYAASDAVNWAGFWIFVGSAVVLWGGWLAARPLVVAPIASLFGRVGR